MPVDNYIGDDDFFRVKKSDSVEGYVDVVLFRAVNGDYQVLHSYNASDFANLCITSGNNFVDSTIVSEALVDVPNNIIGAYQYTLYFTPLLNASDIGGFGIKGQISLYLNGVSLLTPEQLQTFGIYQGSLMGCVDYDCIKMIMTDVGLIASSSSGTVDLSSVNTYITDFENRLDTKLNNHFNTISSGVASSLNQIFPKVDEVEPMLISMKSDILSALGNINIDLSSLDFSTFGFVSLNGNCGSFKDNTVVTVSGKIGDYVVKGSQFVWDDVTKKSSMIVYNLEKDGTFMLAPDVLVSLKVAP